ncbi:MAG: hypothetical protein HYR60_17515 [Acidobacteria bacterium]|nr:hypothetical protein [Acidobacteriota bacterium]MBI3470585.1 hypothetical protein [Candidatus Solibacter usitatus]
MAGDMPQLAVLCVAAAVLLGAASWLLLRGLRDPRDRERRRRIQVNRKGRMGDALITDFRDPIVFYSYEVRGVAYTASQDLTGLMDRVRAGGVRLIGHAGLKYHPRNPANSILICEEWSGLRGHSQKEKQVS